MRNRTNPGSLQQREHERDHLHTRARLCVCYHKDKQTKQTTILHGWDILERLQMLTTQFLNDAEHEISLRKIPLHNVLTLQEWKSLLEIQYLLFSSITETEARTSSSMDNLTVIRDSGYLDCGQQEKDHEGEKIILKQERQNCHLQSFAQGRP